MAKLYDTRAHPILNQIPTKRDLIKTPYFRIDKSFEQCSSQPKKRPRFNGNSVELSADSVSHNENTPHQISPFTNQFVRSHDFALVLKLIPKL